MIPLTEKFKQEFKLHKQFLAALYKQGIHSKYRRNKILETAAESSLNVLIKVLHYICHQQIPVSKHFKDNLTKRRKTSIMQTFYDDDQVQQLLSSPAEEKIAALRKVGPFKVLLSSLFKEKEQQK
jgi:hypothetical protein